MSLGFKVITTIHQELGLLIVLVAVAILTYSSLVYFVEREVSHMEDIDCSEEQYKVKAVALELLSNIMIMRRQDDTPAPPGPLLRLFGGV